MAAAKPRILLVMHTIPVDSGFLGAKFIHLSDKLDVHLLAWDKKEKIDQFIEQYKLPAEYRKRIHLGNDTKRAALYALFAFIRAFLANTKFRKFLFSDGATFGNRLKFSFSFLPAICLKPDIIHCEFGTLTKHLGMLKQATDAKLSSSFRGYDLNYAGLEDQNYYSNAWELLDGVHFLGNDLKQRAVNRGYKGNAVETIIPPAVDTKLFHPQGNSKNFEKLIVVSAGRLVWKKGYEYGIRTVAELKERGIPFEYRIIGEGEYKQALQFVITELDLTNEVQLLGSMNAYNIMQQLSDAHIFLHPAISEGFSNAVLEAQAMGLPVVCSDADGLSENIVNGVTGFVTPKWDVNAMTEKLEWFWKNKEAIKTMGHAGIERVNQYFRQEEQITAFVEFYQKLYSLR